MTTTRGFTGRGRAKADERRVPPGQYVTEDFPVSKRRADTTYAARQVDQGRGSRFWQMTLLGTPITLRQGARVIEDSRRLRVV
jgi:hypothetical protein